MADVEGYKAEIRRTFALVEPIAITAASIFYPTLWEVNPETKVCWCAHILFTFRKIFCSAVSRLPCVDYACQQLQLVGIQLMPRGWLTGKSMFATSTGGPLLQDACASTMGEVRQGSFLRSKYPITSRSPAHGHDDSKILTPKRHTRGGALTRSPTLSDATSTWSASTAVLRACVSELSPRGEPSK